MSCIPLCQTHQSDGSVILSATVSEGNSVLLHLCKVLLGLFARARTQTCEENGSFSFKSQRESKVWLLKRKDKPL